MEEMGDWTGMLVDWGSRFEAFKERIGGSFGRKEIRRNGFAFLDGVLSNVERKTGWMLSEQAGYDGPYRLQSLLGRNRWSADRLRDEVLSFVRDTLYDDDGVLVIDETGFIKKGSHSVGVGRQYSGTAGRIENSQIGVFACYASRYGQALIDRQLYLPKEWAEERQRREHVSVPDDLPFMSKPEIGRAMVSRLLDGGLSCSFVLADALYGSSFAFRDALRQRQQAYILAVRSNQHLRLFEGEGLLQTNPGELATDLPAEAWQTHAAGCGSKGLRLYDWALIDTSLDHEKGWKQALLIRRKLNEPSKLAFYFVYCRADEPLARLAGFAGMRWTIEECFQRAKDDLGLDHCEARSWHGWHRHMTLVMAAAAFLAGLGADLKRAAWSKRDKRSPKPNPIEGRPNRIKTAA